MLDGDRTTRPPSKQPYDTIVERALEIGCFQKADELSGLVRLVGELEPRAVLEVGTCRGGTLFSWCALAHPEALVLSIDMPGGDFGGGSTDEQAEEMRKQFPRPGQAFALLRGDSHEEFTLSVVKDALGGRQLDFLFIDGDHTYEGVKLDFEMYGPLVRPGGMIAFHDVLAHPDVPECQVDQLWREIKDGYRHVEFVAEPDTWGGIGVLWQR